MTDKTFTAQTHDAQEQYFVLAQETISQSLQQEF